MYIRCSVSYYYSSLFIKKLKLIRDKFTITVFIKYFYKVVKFNFNLRKQCLKNIDKVIFSMQIEGSSILSVFAYKNNWVDAF